MWVSLPWVYVHSAIYETIWCSGVAEISCHLEEGWGQSAIGICSFCNI